MGPLEPMLARQEQRVSYPEFYRFPAGDLLFVYRDGGSGNGNLVLNRYSLKTRRWTRLPRRTHRRGGPAQCLLAGLHRCARYHPRVVGVARKSPNVASNHDMAYACSKRRRPDLAAQHRRPPINCPITEKTAEYAAYIPQNSELINQTSHHRRCTRARPYIATYWRPAGTAVPQYQMVYLKNQHWQTTQVGQRTTPFSLSGGGTKKIPISRLRSWFRPAKAKPPPTCSSAMPSARTAPPC